MLVREMEDPLVCLLPLFTRVSVLGQETHVNAKYTWGRSLFLFMCPNGSFLAAYLSFLAPYVQFAILTSVQRPVSIHTAPEHRLSRLYTGQAPYKCKS